MSKKNIPTKELSPAKRDLHLSQLDRWTRYRNGLCFDCEGLCCFMPVEVEVVDLLRMGILTEFHLDLDFKEQVKEALKHPAVSRFTASSQKFTLNQKTDGSCFYLNSDKKCDIYELRPNTCRNHPKIGPRPGYCAYVKKQS